tara:strand:- start:98 stop:778 length:681 start_codon:yes stop_codon:yes gene_type:complete
MKTHLDHPLKVWYDTYSIPTQSNTKVDTYGNGMFITIRNKDSYYCDIVKEFRNLYISLIHALTDNNIKKVDVKQLNGEWKRDRITLPSRENIISLNHFKIPILVGGVHNYAPDDSRTKGREYAHSHFYAYNIHHYLPQNPKDLMDKINKIEKKLSRYAKTKRPNRYHNLIDIRPVDDYVAPTELYDYLRSFITHPDKKSTIQYISNNKHLPSIQYPLSFIYSTKKL